MKLRTFLPLVACTVAVAGFGVAAYGARDGASAQLTGPIRSVCLAQDRGGQIMKAARQRLDGQVYCPTGVLVPLSLDWERVPS